MSGRVLLRLLATLALMFVFGLSSVDSAPSTVHFGAMWPVGFASGALLLSPRSAAPYVAAAIALLAGLSLGIGGYPVDVAVGYAIGVTAEAVVVHQVLTLGWTQRLHLRDNTDFARFMLACVGGAFVGALALTGVSALASFGTPWRVGLAALITHAAAQLVLVGLFRHAEEPGEWRAGERWAAWAVTVAATTIAFIPTEMPSLAFLVIPNLGWMALRAPMREAMVQLVVVSVISSTLTSDGHGPFSDPYLTQHLHPEFHLLPLQAFLIACAMVTIPFSLTVGRQRRSAAEATFERGRSERVVQSARGIAIIGTDEQARITLFNPGAERILGYSAEEVLGRTTQIFHPPESVARMAEAIGTEPTYAALVEHMRETEGAPLDIGFRRKDGEIRTLSTIISPVLDERGEFLGYVATADDVTDRLATQAALETALSTERAAVERLTEIDQVKDRFVSSVSHELRTPITNIVGYLELLMDGVYGEPNEEQARAMSRVDMNSRRLLTLIDDLLTLSRMESIDQARDLLPVDLVSVLQRAEEIVRPGLRGRDLRLEVDLPDEPVVIAGDAGQLERLVINLATNAVKFTRDGGVVTLRLRAPADGIGAVIEVQDTGIGIPADDQAMLFSRFFRATQARESAVPGSGLGLSIAKSIAELHGGRISATSVFGSGSTFRVEFPR
ncbi:MAG TPA: ATP-binding protein [Marmoricola sp.]